MKGFLLVLLALTMLLAPGCGCQVNESISREVRTEHCKKYGSGLWQHFPCGRRCLKFQCEGPDGRPVDAIDPCHEYGSCMRIRKL